MPAASTVLIAACCSTMEALVRLKKRAFSIPNPMQSRMRTGSMPANWNQFRKRCLFVISACRTATGSLTTSAIAFSPH